MEEAEKYFGSPEALLLAVKRAVMLDAYYYARKNKKCKVCGTHFASFGYEYQQHMRSHNKEK